MQKILRKRILRQLKENVSRYLALGFLIILGMFIIISMVAAADTIMKGTENAAAQQQLEDGQFTVFTPLSESERKKLTDKGIMLEEHFYMDYSLGQDVVLRVFEQRKKIDLARADVGRLPEKDGDILMEKRYCEDNGLQVGDCVKIGEHSFTICGIGTVPDYDAPYRNLSDSAVNSSQFGIGFLMESDYQMLKKEHSSIQSENYVYAYKLNDKMTNQELKEILQDFTIAAEDIDNACFQEYWDRTGGQLDEFKDGLSKLTDGALELADGLSELKENNEKIQDGASEIFTAYLEAAEKELSAYGIENITENNYEYVLGNLIDHNDSALLSMKLSSILEQMRKLDAYQNGVMDYTDGVSDVSDGAHVLADGVSEFSKETTKFLDDNFVVNLSKMTQFVVAGDNARIGAAANDVAINKSAGLLAGVIVIILFAYVISVFVIHTIEKESGVIGTLYALGVKRRELMAHYLVLPVAVTFIAGVIGTLIGYSTFGVNSQMKDSYNYFSIPRLDILYELYLLAYGIVMPPLTAAITNFLVIRKKLKKPALKLIRNEQKVVKISKVKLKDGNFVRTFQIRQFLREKRSALAVFFGMFISLLICMISFDTYVLCNHVRKESVADTKYEYMYTYKYPEKNVPDGGEEAYGVTLKKEVLGYNLDVMLLGIKKDNPYFDAPVEKGQNQVLISSAMAQKYQLNTGEDVVLRDEENDRSYVFTVKGIVPYSTSFFAFMDIDSMRELMGEDEDYYNIVFADHKLDIDSERLYATNSKADVRMSAAVFVNLLRPLIIMLTTVSVLIFILVMYLMLKVMIERSAASISMIKIFGYRKNEIRKLYLNGNLFVVAVSAMLTIPLSKIIMDALFPYLVSNVACAINLTFDWWMYVGLFAVILVLYFAITPILMRRISKILPAELLKNRE
ncbi:MAG: FtsX-like permease family protein [Coprococcus sp.]